MRCSSVSRQTLRVNGRAKINAEFTEAQSLAKKRSCVSEGIKNQTGPGLKTRRYNGKAKQTGPPGRRRYNGNGLGGGG
jgi:hypothetical protein